MLVIFINSPVTGDGSPRGDDVKEIKNKTSK